MRLPVHTEAVRHQLVSVQLAQREDPVQEETLDDEQIDHGAARTSDKHSFDKGNIAPAASHQASPADMPDPKKQEHGDAEYWLMQPVYSKEYTENVKPRHIQPEKVLSAIQCVMLFVNSLSRVMLLLRRRKLPVMMFKRYSMLPGFGTQLVLLINDCTVLKRYKHVHIRSRRHVHYRQCAASKVCYILQYDIAVPAEVSQLCCLCGEKLL